jgi:hypothetical protein
VYSGQKISFDHTAWLCYYVEDAMGNSVADATLVTFADDDGDGVRDSCDQCGETPFNLPVDEQGCAADEISDDKKDVDSDTDGLPDYWEDQYATEQCPLDKEHGDSDEDGIEDNQEDYDNDGYSNYMEFVMGTDPCEMTVLDSDGDGIPNSRDQCVNTPPEEIDNVVMDEESELYGCSSEEERDADTFGQPIGEEEEKPGVEVVKKEERPPVVSPVPPGPNLVAIILLLIGVLLVVGGVSYLLYYKYYGFRPREKAKMPPSLIPPGAPREEVTPAEKRFISLRKERERRAKARRRGLVFEAFTPRSKEIPHIERIVTKKGTPLEKMKQLLTTYSKHKETITPGLRAKEKDVFKKLERMSADVDRGKPLTRVVSQKQAKDIFDTLQTLAKERKKKKS